MSRAAKTFLISSIGVSTFVVWGVHYLQQKERDTMYAGVVRDEARQAAKKLEREAREKEFQDQLRRRLYLEQNQSVSNPSSRPEIPDNIALKPMDEVEFQGCKTCQ